MTTETEKLFCPDCRENLITGGTGLHCGGCGREYKMNDNFINFVPDNQEFLEGSLWKKYEIENFDDVESYRELMSRPYFAYLKNKINGHLMKFGIKEKDILEIGSGYSIFAECFEKSNRVFLTDINGKLLNENSGGELLVAADAENLPFKDNSFDFVYVIGAIHHLPNQMRGMSEIKRVLRKNGRVFISEPTRGSLNAVYYLLRRIMQKILGRGMIKKMTGCGTPYESFLDLKKLHNTFKDWSVEEKRLLPLRLPPIKLLGNLKWPVTINRVLEKLPLIKRLGTIIFLDIAPIGKDRGYGTDYEKHILKGIADALVKKYNIKSVCEYPANDLMGRHDEIFINTGVEAKTANPDLIWNFCEFDYADPELFMKKMAAVDARYYAIIIQNRKNAGVMLHRLYHLFLGKKWNHGRIRNMSYKKVAKALEAFPGMRIRETIAFDAPWFILDVYETGRLIKKILPDGKKTGLPEKSRFEDWPFGIKKYLAHHFLILIENTEKK